jgi:hypothetical protein
MDVVPDLGYDSGLIDVFLHRQDRAYTVPQVLDFASQNGLKFLTWLDKLNYSISAYISQPQDLLRKQVESLPAPDQWRLVELITQRLGTHRFLLGHPDRPERDYVLDFAGQGWLDYVPSLRPPLNIALHQRFQSRSSQEEPSATTVRFKRVWHRFTTHAAGLDRRRTVDPGNTFVDGKSFVPAQSATPRCGRPRHLQYEVS